MAVVALSERDGMGKLAAGHQVAHEGAVHGVPRGVGVDNIAAGHRAQGRERKNQAKQQRHRLQKAARPCGPDGSGSRVRCGYHSPSIAAAAPDAAST